MTSHKPTCHAGFCGTAILGVGARCPGKKCERTRVSGSSAGLNSGLRKLPWTAKPESDLQQHGRLPPTSSIADVAPPRSPPTTARHSYDVIRRNRGTTFQDAVSTPVGGRRAPGTIVVPTLLTSSVYGRRLFLLRPVSIALPRPHGAIALLFSRTSLLKHLGMGPRAPARRRRMCA